MDNGEPDMRSAKVRGGSSMARIAPLLAFICLWLIGAQQACSGGLTLNPFWSTYDSKDALVDDEKAPLLGK